MSDQYKVDEDVPARVEATAKSIEMRLQPGLNEKGKVDLGLLKQADPDLHNVLEQFALSKTWRDDPQITATDVAKLLEAQANTTPLGAALEKLSANLKR